MNSVGSPVVWGIFAAIIIAVMAVDLGLLRRGAGTVSMKEATVWTGVWTALSLGFNAFVFQRFGTDRGFQFLQAWLLEQALSIDNVFVFLVIFQYFRVPREFQHRVLFWGVLGAVVTRGIFILAGVALIERFTWLMYLLGVFLVFTAVRLIVQKEEDMDPGRNPVLRLFRRLVPSTGEYDGARFFTRKEGRNLATPLLAVLVVVEATDVVFAVDSIPAVLGVTTDVFIVYTSNIFAILGLRSLFFLIEGLMQKLHYLKLGVAIILAFIGVKILIARWYHMPVALSLGVLAGILFVSTVASFLFPPRSEAKGDTPAAP